MPELPEVEVTRQSFADRIRGARVESVVIPRGAGVSQIGQTLETDGVITSSTVFGWYVRWRHLGGDWKAGTYVRFHRHMKMASVVKLASGVRPWA